MRTGESTVEFDRRRYSAVEILEPVDVVVSGGGVGGVACAAALAECGLKVAVVERRGALGWEVGRARRVFLNLEQAAASSAFAAELHRRLVELGAYKAGVIHAPIAEIVFDRMAVERGIEPLFHAWPVAAVRGEGADGEAESASDTAAPVAKAAAAEGAADGNGALGLLVATKEGYGLIRARAVVETDELGRLVDRALRAPLAPRPVRRSLVLGGVDAAALEEEAERGTLRSAAERAQVDVRPIGDRFVQVDVSLTEPDYAERERAFPAVVRRTLEALRASHPAFAAAGIVYIADDEWGGPSFTLGAGAARAQNPANGAPAGVLFTRGASGIESREIGAGELVFDGRVILAGPWLPGFVEASNTEEVDVLNRICLGEAAARLAASVL